MTSNAKAHRNSTQEQVAIAAFVEHYPPYLGSDRSVFEICKELAKQGLRVHFVATQPLRYLIGARPDDWKYKENWNGPPPKVHENITADYLLVGHAIEKFWRRFPPLAYLVTLWLFVVYSLGIVLRLRPRLIVVAHASPILGVVSFVTAKITGTKLIMGCPDWMTAYAAELAGLKMTNLGPILLQILEKLLYSFSDAIFTPTYYLKRLLVRLGIDSSKIFVVPNGVDPTQFSPEVDTTEIRKKYHLDNLCVILFTGHIEEWAGVSFLYELAAYLDEHFPNARILLVGSGKAIIPLYEKLVSHNLSHMLIHAGLHPFEIMPQFNAAADIALCLFPDTLVSHAASPLKLFEYMAAGRAIVATKVAGTAEVLDVNAGILVPPNDSKHLCEAVLKLCQDEELRRQLGQRARKLIETRYSWPLLAKKFLRLCIRLTR